MSHDFVKKIFIVSIVCTAWLWTATAKAVEEFATLAGVPAKAISHNEMETVKGKVLGLGDGFIVLLGPDGLIGSRPGPNAIVVLGPDGLVCINKGCAVSFGSDNIGAPGPDSLVLFNGESLLGPFKQPSGIVLWGPNGLFGTRTPRGTTVVLGPAGILGPQTGPGGIVLFGENGLLGGRQKPESIPLFGPNSLLPGLTLGGL